MTRNLPQATFTPIDDNPSRLAITGELADMLHELHPYYESNASVVLELTSETFFETDWTLELSWSMAVSIGDDEVWNADLGVTMGSTSINATSVPRFIDWCESIGEDHAELVSACS